MGPHSTQGLIFALALLASPAVAQEAGWRYSPLPGEGDRATLGCDREATADSFACLAVRCEDDFSVGIHIHTHRPDDTGAWDITLDRENATLTAISDSGPYGARILDEDGWLRERLEQGTFIYLRHADEHDGAFRFIDLSGSLVAISKALAFCAPRMPASSEPNAAPGV
jgi:hypothetical protein